MNTLPEVTIAALEDPGTLARTIDADVDEAADVMHRLGKIGIDMDEVGLTLEDEGLVAFHESFHGVLATLAAKSREFCVEWEMSAP